MNLDKIENEVDDIYIHSRDHDYMNKIVDDIYIHSRDHDYMNKIAEEKDYYKYDDNYEYNKEYDEDENKEYDNDKYKMFQGVYIDLKGNIFDVGQLLKYKETTEAIYNYTGMNYTPCVRKSIEAMKDMPHHYIVEPTQASATASWIEEINFEQEVKDYVKDKQHNKKYMGEMYNVIHGQCTKEFINQMRMYPDYN